MAIRLTDFDALGFDVDHTVVHYKLENLYPLVYHSLAKYLVESNGYPKILMEEPFSKYSGFCSRGIIFESRKGNFVKLSKDGKVLRASHGTKAMSEEKLKEVYGEEKKWESFEDFLNQKPSTLFRNPKFPLGENFFDMPAVLLCGRIVDIMDYEETGEDKYRLIWPDVLSALILNFDPRSFRGNIGHFYPSVKADVNKYVHKCSDNVKTWLKKLRKKVKLFLITNSQADFSMFILEAAFGKDWLSYFDVAISRAGKPGFFENEHHFLEVVDGVAGQEEIRDLEEGKYYAEGNSKDLERFIGKLISKPETDIKVLFFGDSLKSDVYPPNFFANWQTVALLEEMAVEINNFSPNNEKGEVENNDCDEPSSKKPRHSGHTLDEDNDFPNKTTSTLQSAIWGSVLHENGQLMDSFYASLIDKYSSLVIPGLDYLAGLDMDHVFVKNSSCSSRFHPRVPQTTT